MFGFLQRSDSDQVVVRSGLIEIHFQIVGCELRQNVAIFELDGTVVLEVYDDGAVQFTARRNAKIFGEFRCRANSLQGNDLGAVRMAPAAYLVGDAADFEGMGVRVLIGDEAADPGDAHQNAFIAQFAQRPVGGHARHAKGFDDVVFGRHTRRSAPLSGTDIVEDMPLHL